MGCGSETGGVRGGDARGDSGRVSISCVVGKGLRSKSVGGSGAGVVVASGGSNGIGFAVGVLTTILDSSSLAAPWWRERQRVKFRYHDCLPEDMSSS